jgi:hypothetical protein
MLAVRLGIVQFCFLASSNRCYNPYARVTRLVYVVPQVRYVTTFSTNLRGSPFVFALAVRPGGLAIVPNLDSVWQELVHSRRCALRHSIDICASGFNFMRLSFICGVVCAHRRL